MNKELMKWYKQHSKSRQTQLFETEEFRAKQAYKLYKFIDWLDDLQQELIAQINDQIPLSRSRDMYQTVALRNKLLYKEPGFQILHKEKMKLKNRIEVLL